jgi:methylenetetrahydrofolate dehydrogenase (NADP+)/methenyltetrahydrofolate cyclohydrolase
MPATILDGKLISQQIREEVAREAKTLTDQGHPLQLKAVLVGDPPAGRLYAQSQANLCTQVSIQYELDQLPEDITQDALCEHLHALNNDPAVTGIMLHMPLPDHLSPTAAQYCIDPYKDVEGVNPANIGFVFYRQTIIAPCTALAVTEIIKHSGVTVRGAEAVVVGQGSIVGRPISLFLLQEMATVTGCHVATRDLAEHTRRAEILIVAVGKPGLIGAEHIRPGALVIDVGINRVTETGPDGKPKSRTVGDVRFDEAVDVAGQISPVPGGVGPVTVSLLLRNTIEAAKKQRLRDK